MSNEQTIQATTTTQLVGVCVVAVEIHNSFQQAGACQTPKQKRVTCLYRFFQLQNQTVFFRKCV